MTGVIQFIDKNTIMDKSTIALVKVLFIVFPLLVGLISQTYMSKEYYQSLFLYSSQLIFDICIKISKSTDSKNGAILLAIIKYIILAFSAILIIFSGVGIFENKLLIQVNAYKWCFFVNVAVFSQAVWYTIEFIALCVCDILKIANNNNSVNISQSCDEEYIENHNI